MFKKLILILLVVSSATAYWGYSELQAMPDRALALTGNPVFQVERGTSASAIASKLESNGWIEDARWMKILYRLHPEYTKIKAGEYQLSEGMTLAQFFGLLNSGESIQYRHTLVEGSTIKELLARLKSNDSLVHTLEAIDARTLAKELEMEYPSAEGLFLAETYQFERGMSDRDLLLRAHQLLNETLETHWADRDAELPLDHPYEALILASIIEKETGVASERPEIAGVFIRRLNKGMRLQTDPTVIYGMGDRYQGNITRADLRRPTDFNTYVIDGLPPTPIATVGPEAIAAALNPNEGKALYFVAKGDGSHQFSETLDQHNRAVREYQLKRRSDYRSSPGEG